MKDLTSYGSLSQETAATEASGTKAGAAPEQLIELGTVSEDTRAFAPTGVFEDGAMIPRGPLYRIWG